MFTKGAIKKYGVSILITLAIIAIVFLIGPVSALVLSITGLPASMAAPGSTMFFLNFDIGPSELIPGGFVLDINGNICSFDVNANKINPLEPLCPQVGCDVVEKGTTVFGQFNANGVYDDYGYGEKEKLKYKCTWTLPCIASGGIFHIKFSTTVDGATFTSPTQDINVIAQQCGGSNSGGAGGAGHCCDTCAPDGTAYHCCGFLAHAVERVNCCDPQQVLKPECLQPTAQGKPQCYRIGCCSGYHEETGTGLCYKGSKPPGETSAGSEGNGGAPTPEGNAGDATSIAAGPGSDENSVSGDASHGFGGLTGDFGMWLLALLLALAALLGLYYLFRRQPTA